MSTPNLWEFIAYVGYEVLVIWTDIYKSQMETLWGSQMKNWTCFFRLKITKANEKMKGNTYVQKSNQYRVVEK